MANDPYGRAIRDWFLDQQSEPLLERYGSEQYPHQETIEGVYFSEFERDSSDDQWMTSWMTGPLLDIGAGVGRHALYFQERFSTVAIEQSHHLVETMQDRGVQDARAVDMFDITEEFERNRFGSVLMIGTQLGLTASDAGLRKFLGDLSTVTSADATAVVDSYRPDVAVETEFPGFVSDPTPGMAYRIMQFEYEEQLSHPLLFRFVTPTRLEEACIGTGWEITDVRLHPSNRDQPVQYRAALRKTSR